MATLTTFNPAVGYSGRLEVSNLNAATALDFANGLADLTVTSTPAANASITRWEITKTVQSGKVLTFESSTDAYTGVAWERELVGGVGSWQVTIEGMVDSDATAAATPETADNTDAFFKVGRYVKMNLLYNKTSRYGLTTCYGKIKSYKGGATAGPEANKFTIEVSGDGAPPAPSMTTTV